MVETNMEVVDFYLRENCDGMTIRELAEHLGISRSAADRRLKKLGLKTGAAKGANGAGGRIGQKTGQAGQRHDFAKRQPPAPEDDRSRLVEVRDMLHTALLSSDAKDIPRISAEYRSVIADLRALDGRAEDDYDDDIDEYR